jgi:hypothetical protein
MRELQRAIEIDAPAATVWGILVDFESYPDWNPLIRHVRGQLREGGKLDVRAELPGGVRLRFRPTVLTVEPGRELRWIGRLPVPRLLESVHRFAVEEQRNGRCRFDQAEWFNGLLVQACSGLLDRSALGFERMNAALKTRAERLVASP